jgi:cytochrome b
MKDPKAFIQTMIALASASLGLVAALAWNEAIKALLALLHLGDSVGALFAYAVVATVLAIVVLTMLGRLAAKIGGEAAFEREAEG